MGRFLRVLTVVLWMVAAAAAQTNGATLRRWNQEVGVWGAFSPDSTVGIGTATNRAFFELNGQYALTIWTPRGIAVKWVSEVVPVALLNEPKEYYFTNHKLTNSRAGATTYAGGVTPLGMQVNLRNGHRVQPFVDAHGGLLYFTRQEPVPQSSQFNFTFNFGAGVQVFTGRRTSVLVGYKYHHISNNETAPQNPGIDNSEAYAGWVWRWK
jgi:opacity protein-like surface antigen